MKKFITFSFLFLLSISFFAQNVALSNKLIQQYTNGQLKATSRNASNNDHLFLTPILNQAVRNWDDLTDEAKSIFNKYLAARPTFTGTELTTESGNFRYHYTTNGGAGESVSATDTNANGIPDYVDNMISKFNSVYTLYHTTTNLTVPPSDVSSGGNAKYDIYISNAITGAGVYGYVAPDTFIGNNPNSPSLTEVDAYNSYMAMRSNYAGFGDQNIALSVTAAHEYMHSTQMGYAISMDTWFMEACATWSEDYAFPGYDDNFQYMMDFFGKTDVALNIENGEAAGVYDNHWYSAWVFVRYLTEHTGNGIIKNIYERCIIHYAATAIDTELSTNWASDLKTLFRQFAISNVLMSSNAVFAPYTYSRATAYKTYINSQGGLEYENQFLPINYSGTPITWNSASDGNNRLMRLSSDYFTFTSDRNFKITFNATTTEAILVLVKATATSVSIMTCNANENINVTDQANWLTFTPIVVRFDRTVTNTNSLNYTLTIGDATIGIDDLSSKFSIYPNPGSDYVTVSTIDDTNYKISISDVTGKQLISHDLTNQNSKIDVRNLVNGIYFLQVKIDNEIVKTEKIIISH
jgi:hypothetical protein